MLSKITIRLPALCTHETEKAGYKGRQGVCMSESGHCSRKSDPNPGHPERVYATALL